jgi:hypothetical protein
MLGGRNGTVLTPAGSKITDTYGPARYVARAGVSDGSTVLARPRTHTVDDQGAPGGGTNPEITSDGAKTLTTGYDTLGGWSAGCGSSRWSEHHIHWTD